MRKVSWWAYTWMIWGRAGGEWAMVAIQRRNTVTPVGIALVGGCLVGLAFVVITLRMYPASTEQTALYYGAAALLILCGIVAFLTTSPRTAGGAELLRLGAIFG